jgi:hypothetical protein
MKVRDLYPSKYLKGEDIQGRSVTVTIEKLTVEKMGQSQETRPVLWFRGARKCLVLNRLNALVIAGMYGEETNAWVDCRVTLYATKIRAFGEIHTVVRVAPEIPPDPPKPRDDAVEETALSDAEDVIDDEDIDVAPQTSQTPDFSSEEVSPSGEAELDAAYAIDTDYKTATDKLSGECKQFAVWCRGKHNESAGPCTDGQYGYLAGVLDSIVDKKGGHRAILTVLVGRAVTKENPPGIGMVSKLLAWLPADKDGQPNPEHKPEYLACVRRIWEKVLEAEGQQRLMEI